MNILAIESSCDETAASVVTDGTVTVSNAVASSHEMHEKYGGIVPEVAARMQLEAVLPVIREALSPLRKSPNEAPADTIRRDIDAIAVTQGPGLIGSLLIGVETAKTIAFAAGKPIIPVNHVLAHMYANFIGGNPVSFPAISLVVSGGHTELYLMESHETLTWLGGTLDDAAGECFDKTARLLGFGNGGGPAIQQAATGYAPKSGTAPTLPKPMLGADNRLNFSFSGLKTAVMREAAKLRDRDMLDDAAIRRLAYDVQESVTDVLVRKTVMAARDHGATTILLSGGVSANLRLREKFKANEPEYAIHVPPVNLCTDNAVYIAAYAFFRGKPEDWKTVTAVPDLSVEV